MNKIIAILLIIFLFCSVSVFAANTDIADKLHDLGLFQGTENGYELNATFTRAQAAAMIVRLFGAEEETLKSNDKTVFDDVANDDWGMKYVMYCYNNNITKGTGEKSFSPEDKITGQEFVTLILRSIGYEANPETAYTVAVTKGMLTSSYEQELQTKSDFLRDDMVYIAYRALKTQTSENISLAQKLVNQGVFTQKQGVEAGVIISESGDMNEVIDGLFD